MGKKKAMPTNIASEVVERAGGACEIMSRLTGCTGYAEHIHHRQLRSQGGQHTVTNCIHICRSCHNWLHAHPAVSYTRGWLVKSTRNPELEPFERRGSLVRLFEDGDLEVINGDH